MQLNKSSWKWYLLAMAVFALVISGCASERGTASKASKAPKKVAASKAPETVPCAAEEKITKEIAPEAELAEFSCSFKKWEGVNTLHFNVAVKNVSQQPQRYRVNIFLDNGKAVGGLIPRKTKKGLVKPGDTASFVYPVKETTSQPKALLVKIGALQ